MTKKEKLLDRIRNNQKAVLFDDLDSILAWYGFVKRPSRSGTSHVYYTFGAYHISVPYKRPYVKEIYVKQILHILDQIDQEQSVS